ncbi:ribosomal protein S18-alanine N-acetyltransferase [Paenalkalicoccus suaedae]|uniref:[Ribosomal protein bS18]-alanine N-acetyltransferase n=1 Tax=Paenalkalicoccus suaedae TaxID=2592382 RepID=A0A859FD78_9BACI|nr:ribosomal protein S18-alanine N-acetyltransferase [Paenalkalicoccus suaedae]QKS70205.1 ribosomal protein S18-alanine N-acetyltransferase [Paenalkalicoccus suaedae]
MASDVQIRLMDIPDIDGVLDVEHDSFPTPWTREAFYNEITKNQYAYYLVAVDGEKVIGYCGLWVIVDSSHITNIAVHSSMRREGIGEALLHGSMEMARMLGAERISLEVRVSNEPAQAMYRKFGFENGGIRKQYYTDNQEDALVMWVKL